MHPIYLCSNVTFQLVFLNILPFLLMHLKYYIPLALGHCYYTDKKLFMLAKKKEARFQQVYRIVRMCAHLSRGGNLCWWFSVGNVGIVASASIIVMDDEQHHPQEEADGAHRHVCDAKEGVLPSHPGDGAQDHALAALEAAHRVVCGGLRLRAYKEHTRGIQYHGHAKKACVHAIYHPPCYPDWASLPGFTIYHLPSTRLPWLD